ncbi:phosphatase [Nocardiopsis terrae]|uniref:Metal-dependent phosphoesterase TrpH n=1 Tax=Nocardiopsis terrae TaxID=372655 RepID=A0ABR9HCI9_9ACTN|nr:PHP domain-containing protein [Nocardiopsis terrae]MBE1456510.1 putative metal-dependent phosphoesterase TrpH [Nocardiopsis terrae]GHC76474.1 phosphatase [Nocardiopsis terrae]
MTRIDLHSHSSVSDGTDAPAEVIAYAVAAGLDVLALTDHDTVGGIEEAARHLPPDFTLVPGMELSCAYEGSSVHLVSYLFDPDSPGLDAELRRVRSDRASRAEEMVYKLQAHGVEVTWERVLEIAGAGQDEYADANTIGRPHLARAVVEAGAARNVQDAFDRWIGSGGPAYASRYAIDPVRAVELVRQAGGVCALAHPARAEGATNGAVPVELAERMAEAGLGGIEADHPSHNRPQTKFWRGVAADLGVVVTGSSDDHGALTGHRMGCRTTSPEAFDELIAPATGVPLIKG